MSDDVKQAIEWLGGLARNWEHAHADVLLAHLDGEPARLAAAREEQREACARSCPTCKGASFTMRVRECPFCNDSTHDHECPTDLVKWPCLCGAARIRAMPLDSTPLGDELAQVRRERKTLQEDLLAAEKRIDELRSEAADLAYTVNNHG